VAGRKVTGWRARIAAVVVAGGAAAALIALSPGAGTGSRASHAVEMAKLSTPTVLTGSITQTDKMWTCTGPVDLDSVSVTMTAAAQSFPRTEEDAIHLESGCTGSIGSITIVQSAGDGLKVGNGAHDITIGGGSIRCLDKSPNLHQDGIQVMSGADITFQNLTVDCGRPGTTGIDSDIFFNKGTLSTVPPTDVVCDGCHFGPGAAHTVSIQDSTGSGVRNSVLCPASFPKLTLAIGPDAVDPVNVGNQLVDCDGETAPPAATAPATTTTSPAAGSRLTIGAPTTVVANGSSLVIGGALQSGHSGRVVDVYEQPFGASTQSLVATTRTDASGRWQLIVHPSIQTAYSAQARSVQSARLLVQVRPVIVLHAGGGRLTLKVAAGRPLAGRTVRIQRLAGSAWRTVGTVVLGAKSGAIFPLGPHAAGELRASLPAVAGYLGATSAPVTVAASR